MKVDLDAIEQELGRIQRELTNTEVRTSLFTLVVFCSDAQEAMADRALGYLLGKRAARVIHVVNDANEESRIDVSARCFIDEHRKGVCFQEIIITNGRDNAGGAPGTWIPLLIRDLPTYVMWNDSMTDKIDVLHRAREQADKLIIDSDRSVGFGDDQETLIDLLKTLAVQEQVPVADFAWKRIRPFRRLTAAAFDSENRVSWLSQVGEVTISGLGPASGALYGLWLAERLGWKRDGRMYRDSGGRKVVFTTSEEETDCDFSIAISLTNGEKVDVVAYPHGCVDVDSSDGGSSKRVVVLPSDGESLLEEVDSASTDARYRSALSVY